MKVQVKWEIDMQELPSLCQSESPTMRCLLAVAAHSVINNGDDVSEKWL